MDLKTALLECTEKKVIKIISEYPILTDDKKINVIKSEITKFENKKACEVFLKYHSVFIFMGNIHDKNASYARPIFEILYCLLTNSVRINGIEGVQCYDRDCDKFINVNIINNNYKKIKFVQKTNYIEGKIKREIKLNNITNVFFELGEDSDYKIYRVNNQEIEDVVFFGDEINFNLFKHEYDLIPYFQGNINNIKNDFKCLSIENNLNENHIKNLLGSISYYTDKILYYENKLKDEIEKLKNY